jgi:hypothetical protein
MSHAEQVSLHTTLSRYSVQLMLQMKLLLMQHGIDVSLTAPDAYAQLLRASQAIDDADVQQYRVRLLEQCDASGQDQAIPASPPSLRPTPAAHVADTPASAQPSAPSSCQASEVSGEESAFASAPLKTVTETTKGDVFLTCDSCQRILAIKLKRLQETEILPIACPCGMRFQVELDVRKYTRKSTRLPGVYRCERSGKTGGLVVEDLSFGGMRFEVATPHAIALNDRLQVSFTLDDTDRTIVHEYVCVQSVCDKIVGAIFTQTNDFDKALAAYLMQQ